MGAGDGMALEEQGNLDREDWAGQMAAPPSTWSLLCKNEVQGARSPALLFT